MRYLQWCVLLVSASSLLAQERRSDRNYPPSLPEARAEVYKTVGEVELSLYIFEPADHKPSDRRAAIIFFFGGGWRSGTPGQFHQHCKYLASRGMVAMAADYRVASRHQTKVVHCVADGKSAIRWVRANAERLGVDPGRIVASGGSAGGHVAACTGTIRELDESKEDASINSAPNAMVLFNPALVLSSVEGRAPFERARLDSLRDRVGEDPKKVSPYHHVRRGMAPTVIFHGTDDATVPYWTAELFAKAMKDAGNQCELVGFDGQGHGFFNYGRGDGDNYVKTVRRMDEFLASLDFLEGTPRVGAGQ